MEKSGLSMPEFEVIAALVRQGAPFSARPTELGRALIISSGAVTARLAALERRELIVRRPDDEDGRVQLVTLTAHALYLFDPALDAAATAAREIVSAMAGTELQDLHSALRGLLTVLELEE
ncbi:MarR family winged helix-turn-helix transcriptional regulator [Rhodococcus erythropolis]